MSLGHCISARYTVASRVALSSSSWAPPSGFLIEGPEPIQRASRPVSIRPPDRGPSPRHAVETTRGSPSSPYADNYAVAVGSTAYHVTTLLPLRAAILSPAAEPGPSAPSSASVSDSPGIAAERAPSQAASVQEVSAESEPVSTALATGKRRRRTRAEKGKESASSSSSEHAHAPKSKKTLIACHFCRGKQPTFSGDGGWLGMGLVGSI